MAPNRRDALRGSNPLAPRSGLEDLTDSMLPPKSSSLVKSSDGQSLLYKQYKLTPVGLEVHGLITMEDWKAGGEFLRQAGAALQWWIGDWIRLVPATWGEMYRDAVDITGYDKEYLQNIVSVAERVKFSFRNEKLSFSHHMVIAGMEPADQTEWLKYAEDNHLSVTKLRQAINGKPGDKIPPVLRSYNRKFHRTLTFVAQGQFDRIKVADIDPLVDWLLEIKKQKEGQSET